MVKSCGLNKKILQGAVTGGRKREKQNNRREDNIKEWTKNVIADIAIHTYELSF